MAKSKKDLFKEAFLTIKEETQEDEDIAIETNVEEESPQAIVKESEIVEQAETIESVTIKNANTDDVSVVTNTNIVKSDQIELSLKNDVDAMLEEAEKQIDMYNSKPSGFSFKRSKKMKYSDMYAGVTISMNRYIAPIIEYLEQNSGYTKTEIIEMLLVNGLKHTNFE